MTDLTDEDIDQALYDLILIGCMHFLEVYTEGRCKPAFAILGAVWQSESYPLLFRRKVTARSGLRNKVQLGSHIVRASARSSSSASFIRDKIPSGDAPHDMAMFVRPGLRESLTSPLDYTRILGTNGYPLVLTESGQAAAREALEVYEDLTRQAFLMGEARFQLLPRHKKEAL